MPLRVLRSCKLSAAPRAWRGQLSSRAPPRMSPRRASSAAGRCSRSGRAASRCAWRLGCGAASLTARPAVLQLYRYANVIARRVCEPGSLPAWPWILDPRTGSARGANPDHRRQRGCHACDQRHVSECCRHSFAGSSRSVPMVVARQPVRRPHLDELGSDGAPSGTPNAGTAPLQVSRLMHCPCLAWRPGSGAARICEPR